VVNHRGKSLNIDARCATTGLDQVLAIGPLDDDGVGLAVAAAADQHLVAGAAEANALLTRPYRAPFVVPDKV
jgi:hypothetical protein